MEARSDISYSDIVLVVCLTATVKNFGDFALIIGLFSVSLHRFLLLRENRKYLFCVL